MERRGFMGRPMSAQFLVPDGFLQNWALPPTPHVENSGFQTECCANRQECEGEKKTYKLCKMYPVSHNLDKLFAHFIWL